VSHISLTVEYVLERLAYLIFDLCVSCLEVNKRVFVLFFCFVFSFPISVSIIGKEGKHTQHTDTQKYIYDVIGVSPLHILYEVETHNNSTQYHITMSPCHYVAAPGPD
jgi:hypothetical protein